MKVIKKITAIMFSIMMVLGMSSVVSAAGASGTGKIKINNAVVDQTYNIVVQHINLCSIIHIKLWKYSLIMTCQFTLL